MVQKNVGFGYSNSKKKKRHGKGFLLILIVIIIILIWGWMKYSPSKLNFENEKVSVIKGDTISKFYDVLDDNQIFWMKLYIKRHPNELPRIQEGTYIFSGSYSNSEFLSHIGEGPEKEYISYTILEGWSIYDIDNDLASKGYINEGDYISYVTNPSKISELSQRYDFFDSNVPSLEGFLYPDTYYLDNWGNLVNQLVSIQLNTFKSKVWENHVQDFKNIENVYGLSVYEAITLASIIEKEEKLNENKPTVAGIFYNRLQNGLLLGADITLCYGLAQPYNSCTPNVIVKNLNDSNNKYNTRAVAGLTPTPIGNPAITTIEAVLFPEKTSYLFYLHDSNGGIHYAETNAQHEQNKAQYL